MGIYEDYQKAAAKAVSDAKAQANKMVSQIQSNYNNQVNNIVKTATTSYPTTSYSRTSSTPKVTIPDYSAPTIRPSSDQIWAADVTQQIQSYQDSHSYLPAGTVADMINQRYTGQINDANFARIQNSNPELAGIIQEGVNIRSKIDSGNFNDNPVVLPNYSGTSGEREDLLWSGVGNGRTRVDVNQVATTPDGRVLVPGQAANSTFSPMTGPTSTAYNPYTANGITEAGAQGYVGSDGRTYAYPGSDFAPGTFGEGPYSNPFNKESLDALDPSVKNELLNRQDAVGDAMRQAYYGNSNGSNGTPTTQTPTTGVTGTQKSRTSTTGVTGTQTSRTSTTGVTGNPTTQTSTTGVTGTGNNPFSGNTQLMQAYDNMSPEAREYVFSQNPDARSAYDAYTSNKGNNTSGVVTNDNMSSNISRVGLTSSTTTPSTTATTSAGFTGSSTSSVGAMTLNAAGIDDIIGKINECITSTETTWQSILNNEINKINNSWVANEAKTYVDKAINAGNKINTVNEGLKLLSSTYAKVNSESGMTQQDISRYINSI